MSQVSEMHFYRDGIVFKKVLLIKYPRHFMVQELEARYDLGPKTNVSWDTTYQIEFPNYGYAKTNFMGRVTQAAFEEGGVTDLAQERREAAMYSAIR